MERCAMYICTGVVHGQVRISRLRAVMAAAAREQQAPPTRASRYACPASQRHTHCTHPAPVKEGAGDDVRVLRKGWEADAVSAHFSEGEEEVRCYIFVLSTTA